jgi:hypothetical protein
LPSADRHKKQRQRNADAYVSLGKDQSPYIEWAVTVLFYMGVHAVEEYLASLTPSLCSSNHTQRYRWIADKVPAAAAKLRTLEEASRTARYDCAWAQIKDREVLKFEAIATQEIPRLLQLDATRV